MPSMLEKLLSRFPKSTVIEPVGKFVPIDFSIANTDLESLSDAGDYQNYIDSFLKRANASAAFGGYNEKRNLYQASELFDDDGTGIRDIHIGIDIWTKEGTAILAPIDGKIHSFNYNAGKGNYGPAIILEHFADGLTFYTLYGHLSVDSISEIEIGDTIRRGEAFAALGGPDVNGGYAPHLHFQIIEDIGDRFGDYPGVCSENEREAYLRNCPDPELLLKLTS